MSAAFVRNWWAFLIRGLIGIGVGIVSFLRPGITLVALVLLFGAYALLDGVVCLAGAVQAAEKHEHWEFSCARGSWESRRPLLRWRGRPSPLSPLST